MTIDWGDYQPFDPGVARPLHELPRREAKAAYERCMAAKADRIERLSALVGRNGLRLDGSDEAIQALDDWFSTNVERSATDSTRLRNIWYAVVNDIALFLGDVLIERIPNLRWVFFERGKNDVSFQRHVIMGFTGVANPAYNVDIDLAVAIRGQRIVAGLDVGAGAFVQWIRAAESEA